MAVTHSPRGAPGEWPESLDIVLRSLRPIEEKVVRWSYGDGLSARPFRCRDRRRVWRRRGVGGSGPGGSRAAISRAGVTRQQLQQAGQPMLRSRHGCRGR